MEILFIAPEIAPYSRTGEVGDVCAALPKGLRSAGHKVTVVSPLWAGVEATARNLARRLSGVEVQLGDERLTCTLFDGRTTGGVELVFVSQPTLFGDAGGPSDSPAGLRAAIGFAQAAAAIAASRSPQPEVVHAHGYFAAVALPLCEQTLPTAARVLSLHDAQQLGALTDARALLPATLAERAGGAHASLLWLGADAAQRVVARSPGEAAVLLEQLAPALRATLDSKLSGIANGLDAARWNPLTDVLLAARYDAVSHAGKVRCKDALQLELALPVRAELPLIACLLGASAQSRALVVQALPGMLRNDVQVVLLAGEPSHGAPTAELAELRARFSDRLALAATSDERTLHRALAAADLLVVPERNARDGELHLAAQRYGALPVAPNTPPLSDAIVDCDASMTTGTGFLFEAGSADDLAASVQRAVAAYADTEPFAKLRTRVMRLDLAWERSARSYEHLYKAATAPRL